MLRTIHFLPLIILFFCACGSSKTANNHDSVKVHKKEKIKVAESFKKGIVAGTEIIKSNKTPYEEGFGKFDDTTFMCAYKGKVEMTDSMGKNRQFLFNLNVEFMIDKIFILPLSGKRWLVSWEETDHEGVKSYAAVYKTGDAKPQWKLLFDVPNPGMPVLDGNDIYITYLGIVAKLSVDDGKFKWQHDSLFTMMREPFKKFEKPRVFDDRVEFVDYPNPGHRERRDTLIVNPVTGEAIRR
jgi:hypothetical protein